MMKLVVRSFINGVFFLSIPHPTYRSRVLVNSSSTLMVSILGAAFFLCLFSWCLSKYNFPIDIQFFYLFRKLLLSTLFFFSPDLLTLLLKALRYPFVLPPRSCIHIFRVSILFYFFMASLISCLFRTVLHNPLIKLFDEQNVVSLLHSFALQ